MVKLSDYRGKVVVLTFSGDWCVICRSEYPYQRFLEELYADWPFAIVGVNSDSSPEAARAARAKRGLSYPTWWEARGTGGTRGPIASAYNLYGWPTIYVLDAEGVIRFVDVRDEDLLKAVRQLLEETQRSSTPVDPQPRG